MIFINFAQKTRIMGAKICCYLTVSAFILAKVHWIKGLS